MSRRYRKHERSAIFYWETGLEYRWWRRVEWGCIVMILSVIGFYAMLILVIGAWWFDWKPFW